MDFSESHWQKLMSRKPILGQGIIIKNYPLPSLSMSVWHQLFIPLFLLKKWISQSKKHFSRTCLNSLSKRLFQRLRKQHLKSAKTIYCPNGHMQTEGRMLKFPIHQKMWNGPAKKSIMHPQCFLYWLPLSSAKIFFLQCEIPWFWSASLTNNAERVPSPCLAPIISQGYARKPCSLCFCAMVLANCPRAAKVSLFGMPLHSTGSNTSTLRLPTIPASVSTACPPQP